ncbi:hypothetical protein F2P79_010070 [Pimephales promelas]|nr:hypothetical protein F2P79_010070 [Pimephales promelas]
MRLFTSVAGAMKSAGSSMLIYLKVSGIGRHRLESVGRLKRESRGTGTGLKMNDQVKDWNQDLKCLQTGVSTEDEEPRAASWKWCHGHLMDEVPSLHLPLRDPPSLHLPLLPQIVKCSAAQSQALGRRPLVNSSEWEPLC